MKTKVLLIAAIFSISGLSCELWTPTARQTAEQKQVGQILNATGVEGGLIVHLGCGDGRLTAALCANDSPVKDAFRPDTFQGFLVHGLDKDADNIKLAREHVKSLGLYGKVTVEKYSAKYLPYTDNLVNLIVSEQPVEIPMTEIMRVLAPKGAAYIKKGDTWTKHVKPRPKEIDEWTHFLHDAGNNAVAADTVVAPPYHLQWVGGPKWARSHDHLASVSAAVSSGGRIFYIVDEGPIESVALPAKWSLVARDAFNGVVLWKRPVGTWEGQLRGFRSGPSEIARRLIAIDDRVFVTLGYGRPVTALDAATGKMLKTYKGTDNTLEILCDEGLLFLVAGDPTAQAPSKRVHDMEDWLCYPQYVAKGIQRHLMVFEADSGNLLWEKTDDDTAEIMPTTLAVDDGRLFFQNTKQLFCLDAKSGDELWRTARPVSINRWAWSAPTLVVHDGVVLSADRDASSQVDKGPAGQNQIHWVVSSKGGEAPVGKLIAFSAETGNELWRCDCRECYNAPVDVLVANGLVWTGDLVRSRDPGFTVARDLRTGEIKKKRPPDSEQYTVGMGHHRCYRNKASERYLLLGRAGVEFIDLESGKAVPNHWVRGTCQYGIMPCNGLLYAPSHSCACYIQAKLNGFSALAPRRKSGKQKDRSAVRLERGPAYGKIDVSEAVSGADWPTYRHDPARSGCTKSTLAADLKFKWKAQPGGRLTSPVVAEGRVFVASIDTHTLHAMDADDGKTLWTYTTGGRVDSPPTIHRGLVLFGCADGWVYCLRASDGELAWRFRAAPQDRRVVAYGQLESVWPIHGSVLVNDDIAYCAAGRSSFLDGGINLYRLDPKTGKLLSETRIDSRDPKTGAEPQQTIRGTDMPGALPDVLSSDGKSVYMRHMRFDLNGNEQESNVSHLYSPAGFLDDSWWHRTYWMIGTKMSSGYGGWPRVGNVVPAGRMLVFDSSDIYGFGRNQYGTHGSHLGLGRAQFRLFAASRTPLKAEKPAPKPAEKKKRRRAPARSTVKYHWSRQTPLVCKAMVLADKTLFVVGEGGYFDPNNTGGDSRSPATGCPAEKDALLFALSTEDGKRLAEYKLDSPPVFDGLIAANDCLFISTRDGRLLCMGRKL